MGMWAVSEVAAMATDLAEFLGGAIGLSLLLHIPLLAGMVVVGIVTYAILLLDRAGFRPLEIVIGAIVALISLCYLVETVVVPPNWLAALGGTVVPRLPDNGALLIAVAICGRHCHAARDLSAFRPHAEPAPARNGRERRMLVHYSNIEVIVALTVAGFVNAAMIMMAAAAFHKGHPMVAEIGEAYTTLAPLFGAAAAGVFLVSLLASGISSSVVGTMAGQVIMQGFVGWRIPVWVRRLATMLPAFVVVAAGADATKSLLISQVVLSIALPVPMIALVLLSRRRDVMGAMRLRTGMFAVASVAAAATLALNFSLLLQQF